MNIQGTLYSNIQPNVRNNYIIGHTLSDYVDYLDNFKVKEVEVFNYNLMENNILSFEISNLSVDINKLTYFYVEYTNNNNVIDYRFYHITNATITSGKVVCNLSIDMFATNYFRTDIKCVAIASNKVIPNKSYYLNDNNNETNERYVKDVESGVANTKVYCANRLNTQIEELSKENYTTSLDRDLPRINSDDMYFVMFANIPSIYTQILGLGENNANQDTSCLTRQQVCLSIKASDILKLFKKTLQIGAYGNPIMVKNGNTNIELAYQTLSNCLNGYDLSDDTLLINFNPSIKDCLDILTNLYYVKLGVDNSTPSNPKAKLIVVRDQRFVAERRPNAINYSRTLPDGINNETEGDYVKALQLTTLTSNSEIYLLPKYLLPSEITYEGTIFQNQDETLQYQGRRVIFAVDSVKNCNYIIMKMCDLDEQLINISKFSLNSNNFNLNDRISFGTNNKRVYLPYKKNLKMHLITTLNRNGLSITMSDDNSINEDITSCFKTTAPFQTSIYDNTAETRRQYALASSETNYREAQYITTNARGMGVMNTISSAFSWLSSIITTIAGIATGGGLGAVIAGMGAGNAFTTGGRLASNITDFTSLNGINRYDNKELQVLNDYRYQKDMAKAINYGYTGGTPTTSNNIDCYSTYSYLIGEPSNLNRNLNLVHPLFFFKESTKGNFADNVFLNGANYESTYMVNSDLCNLDNYDYILSCDNYSNYNLVLPNTTKHLNYIKGEVVINNAQVEVQQYFTNLFNSGFLYYVI